MSGRPLDVLEETLGETVTVRLKNDDAHIGELGGYDQHMNLVLDPLTTRSEDDDPNTVAVKDTTIIRGDNVISIQP